jgi:hypothetical protein
MLARADRPGYFVVATMVDDSILGRNGELRGASEQKPRLPSRFLRAWHSMPLGDQVAAIAIALCIALGIFLRVRGMFYRVVPFWEDEAFWTEQLLKGDIREFFFRPLGFMLSASALVKLFGSSEVTLRILPWLGGVLAVFATVPMGRLLFRSNAARVLLVAIVALHPAAIDLSKEFKPYSGAFFFHSGIVLGALVYTTYRKRSWLWLTLSFALVGMFFSQDVIFAYPGLYLALAHRALRERDMAAIKLLGAACALTIGVLLLLYFLTWRPNLLVPRSEGSEFWGRKYDVFFIGSDNVQRFLWWLAKYRDTAALPGLRRIEWAEGHAGLAAADSWLWAGLHLIGLAVIALGRRLREALLLVLPLLVLSAFNALGFWPFGAFRTDLFTLAYAAPLACMALDWPMSGRLQNFAMVPALALIFVPLFTFETDWHKRKEYFTASSAVPQSARALLELQGPEPASRESLVLHNATCHPWTYYTEIRPGHERISEPISRRFHVQCAHRTNSALAVAARRLQRQASRVWVIYNDGTTLDHLKPELASRRLSVVASRSVRDGIGLVLALERAGGEN